MTFAVFTVEVFSSAPPACCGTSSVTETGAEESVGPLATAATCGANGTAPQPEIGAGGVAGVFGVTSPASLSSVR